MASSIDGELSEGDSDFDKEFDEDAADQIFHDCIVPKCARGIPLKVPTFAIVGGEPGVGKTHAMSQVKDILSNPTQEIVPDRLACEDPEYPLLAERDQRRAQETVGEFIGHCTAKLTELTFQRGINSAKEFSLPLGMEEDLDTAREYGCRKLFYLKVAQKEVSFTSLQVRANWAHENNDYTSFVVSDSSHDQRYAAWPRAIYDAERKMQFDSIFVVRRDGSLAYENHLRVDANGRKVWTNPIMGFESVMIERLRAIGPETAEMLEQHWTKLPDINYLHKIRAAGEVSLEQHRDRILRFIHSAGSKFDPFLHNAVDDPEGAHQWLDRLTNDLELVRSSRGNMGYSEEFDRHTHLFQAAMSDLATRGAIAIEADRGDAYRAPTMERSSPGQVSTEHTSGAQKNPLPSNGRNRSEERCYVR